MVICKGDIEVDWEDSRLPSYEGLLSPVAAQKGRSHLRI